ncbi:hypothetical protein J2I47_21490 [Fibrella sp. HMF5335]|uniref:Uncharacterized protein n=1 Tax=Fibrella rubiginis TaxID=2817060 RepID=A0A939K6R9_9BACT|nr:hypothetical protein [Fibrella rubiginis]MBO0939143.1 hypothetical protein [Fibrella rubiginis]
MSAKAFYQTFFQTEQLFRRADDALSFPALHNTPDEQLSPAVTTESLLVDAESVDIEPIVIAISDPVLPPVPAKTEVADVAVTEPAGLVQPAVVETAAILVEPAPVAPAAPAATPPTQSTGQPNDSKPPVSRKPVSPQISQKVLILVDEEMQASDLLFLEKILKAVHLDIDGVDLLNVHGTSNVNFSELLKGKYIHHFFTFGVPFSRINLDILMDRYQPVRFDGITFLMADSLPAIETDVALKKKLWEALKKIFLWR